ncbi:uncharacterized protein Triagg1_2400 [Trichoderma aggressivum f. europaeum]|uniref:Uncharacterized protein n=1 Tax=Trichoderma aggressivum f. europaeum TaxID=173218 RepID=A0AAE1M224_9HYPO|nr:hypothetical protein Triagg1_2400 [Trichoderma aggressivum f. europaeum]
MRQWMCEGENAMGVQHTQKVALDHIEDVVPRRWLYAIANRRATMYGSRRRLGGVTLFTWPKGVDVPALDVDQGDWRCALLKESLVTIPAGEDLTGETADPMAVKVEVKWSPSQPLMKRKRKQKGTKEEWREGVDFLPYEDLPGGPQWAFIRPNDVSDATVEFPPTLAAIHLLDRLNTQFIDRNSVQFV